MVLPFRDADLEMVIPLFFRVALVRVTLVRVALPQVKTGAEQVRLGLPNLDWWGFPTMGWGDYRGHPRPRHTCAADLGALQLGKSHV